MRTSANTMVRRIGGGILIVAAALIWFALQPTPSAHDDVEAALSRAEINEQSTESAPQQQVVNGWATRDLLEIIARDAEEPDHRLSAMAGLLVVAIGFHLITEPRRVREVPTSPIIGSGPLSARPVVATNPPPPPPPPSG